MPTEVAAELTLRLRDSVELEAQALADYETEIGEARSRGVMGRGIYDSLHATFARRKKDSPNCNAQPVALSACRSGHWNLDSLRLPHLPDHKRRASICQPDNVGA